MGKPVADPWNAGPFNPGSEFTMWLEHPLFYALLLNPLLQCVEKRHLPRWQPLFTLIVDEAGEKKGRVPVGMICV
jgi:hypothetical protein